MANNRDKLKEFLGRLAAKVSKGGEKPGPDRLFDPEEPPEPEIEFPQKLRQAADALRRFAGAAAAWLRKNKREVIPAGIAAVAVVVVVVVGFNTTSSARLREELTVLDAVAVMASVETHSDFLDTGALEINGVAGLDVDYLRENLKVFKMEGDKETRATFWVDKISTAADTATVTVKDDRWSVYTVRLHLPTLDNTLEWMVNQPTMFVSLLKSSISPGESIYLQFSKSVNVDALQQYLTINCNGSLLKEFDLRCEGQTVEIRPYYSANGGDRFEIAIGRNVTAEDGDRLDKNYSFSVAVRKPRDEPKRPYAVTLTNPGIEILQPDQTILVEFDTNGKYWPAATAVVAVYRFDSVDKYISQTAVLNDKLLKPETLLEKVEADLVQLDHGLSKIELPNPGVGAYLVEAKFMNPLTGEEQSFRKAVQVTEMSVYLQSLNGETLAWVNSGATGGPLAGQTVEFLDDKEEILVSGVTDAGGVAVMKSDFKPEENESWPRWPTLRVKDTTGATVYADETTALTTGQWSTNNRYFSYFYMDRSLYKPTDEISFWGYIQAHVSNSEGTPKQVRIVLDPSGLNLSVMADVDANNIFHGTLPIQQIKSGNYEVRVGIPKMVTEMEEGEDGQQVEVQKEVEIFRDAAYVEIKEYQKPLFKMTSEVDKLFYSCTDDVMVNVTPRFYDGTALPNYELEFSVFDAYYGDVTFSKNIMTDETGMAHVTFPAFQQKANSEVAWRPVTTRYKVRIISEGEDITHYGTYTYFPTDTVLTAGCKLERGGKISVDVLTSALNLTGIKTAEDLNTIMDANYYDYTDSENYDNDAYTMLKGAPVDAEVTMELNLEYYDTFGVFRSDKKTVKVNTVDGLAAHTDSMGKNMDIKRYSWLYVSCTMKDGNGRTMRYANSTYVASDDAYDSGGYTGFGVDPATGVKNFYKGYSFNVINTKGESAIGDYSPYMPFDMVSFNAGESFDLTLQYDGEPVQNQGRILYTILQENMIERNFSTQSSLRFTETTDWANNVNIVAAYFDGKQVYIIRDTYVTLAKDSIRLNVEVTPDRLDYVPGDTVNLTLKITDQSGRGVAGTSCVSIVDESIFALREQSISVLEDLYRQMYFNNSYVDKYATSKRNKRMEEGKGDGGKGGDNSLAAYDTYRKNFRDTALFRSVRTDAGGNARLSFTLPDNTTSWRVTTLSIGDNRFAGQGQTNFTSSLPFFVSPVISNKYIEGDDIALLMRGYGSLLTGESKVSFSVSIQGDGVNEVRTADNVAFQASHLNFGPLPVGEYTVVATARFGNYSDTVEVPVSIISSNLELVVHKELDLTKPLDITAMRYPVTVSFYSKEHAAYYKSVSSLLTHYCMSASQRLSRYVAKDALMRTMDEADIPQYLSGGNDSVSDLQNFDGGIGYYEGSGSDVLLTTQVVLVAKDQFNLRSMTTYYNDVIARNNKLLEGSRYGSARAKTDMSYSRDEVVAAYLGLAHIGEPVTEDVRALLKLNGTTIQQKATLIAALAYAGETEEAQKEYDAVLALQTISSQGGKRLRSNDKDIDDDQLTAAAWVAAIKLGHQDADAFATYFSAKSWRISTLFECMVYVQAYDKPVAPLKFDYNIGGVSHAVDLGYSGQKTLRLNRSDLESLKMGNMPDDLTAMAYYIGEPSEVDIAPTDKFTVEKKITATENNRYKVELTLNMGKDAPTGQYDISDWIPSNMRMYDMDRTNYKDGEGWWYSTSQEGQKLYIKVQYKDALSKTIRLTYYIQEVYEAGATVDSTYVIHGDSGENAFSPRYRWNLQ